MLTERDKMFGDGDRKENQISEEEIELAWELFENFIEGLETGEIEEFEYEKENHLAWNKSEHKLTWETELHL